MLYTLVALLGIVAVVLHFRWKIAHKLETKKAMKLLPERLGKVRSILEFGDIDNADHIKEALEFLYPYVFVYLLDPLPEEFEQRMYNLHEHLEGRYKYFQDWYYFYDEAWYKEAIFAHLNALERMLRERQG